MKNSLNNLFSLLTCLAFVVSCGSSPALADHTSAKSNSRLNTIDLGLNDLHQQKDSVRKGGPIAGVVISTLLIPAGAFTIGAGAALAVWDNFSFSDDPDPHQTSGGARALIATGAVAMVGGLIGVGISAKKLRDRKKEVQRIDANIQQLESERMRVSTSYGAPQKPAMLRF